MTNVSRFSFLFAFAALSSQAAISMVDARSGETVTLNAEQDPLYRLNAYHALTACFTGTAEDAVATVNALAANEGIEPLIVDDMGGDIANKLVVETAGNAVRVEAVIHDEYGGYEIDRVITACE